jgi:hypothetical protein
LEKRKEYEAVLALDKVSAELVERLEALGDDCEIMADAGQGADCLQSFLISLLYFHSSWKRS